MFLMIGVNDGRTVLYYEKLVYFTHLGNAVNVTIFVTFTQLLLFFIPTVKWNKHYYVQLPNGEVFELNAEVGRAVERGRDVDITEKDCFLSNTANYYYSPNCPHCGYPIVDDFDYCPKCGRRLK